MSTKSKAEKQAAAKPKPSEVLKEVPNNVGEAKPQQSEPPVVEPVKEKPVGKIAQILAHHLAGKTNKEIADLKVVGGDDDGKNFHATTIAIQVTKYKKAHPEKYADEVAAKAKAKADKELEKKEKKEAAEAKAKEAETPAPAVVVSEETKSPE